MGRELLVAAQEVLSLTWQDDKSFESSRAPEPVGAFPHAKRVGELLFLSGIGPRVRGSKEIPGRHARFCWQRP